MMAAIFIFEKSSTVTSSSSDRHFLTLCPTPGLFNFACLSKFSWQIFLFPDTQRQEIQANAHETHKSL